MVNPPVVSLQKKYIEVFWPDRIKIVMSKILWCEAQNRFENEYNNVLFLKKKKKKKEDIIDNITEQENHKRVFRGGHT